MLSTAALFRKRLEADTCLIGVGAYDALSARLVQAHGFDALWISSFCVSAARGFPDAGILTLTELLHTTEQLLEAAEMPAIVDCDNGYGEVAQLSRAIRLLERAGAAAVSIEDSAFPKRSSLYSIPDRMLVPTEQFTAKIRIAKEAQRSNDFAVIARTEALVAGLGMAEALERAARYADAGADLILIHSVTKEKFASVVSVAGSASLSKPLAIVPNTVWQYSTDELRDAGFKLIIYANQQLRAAVKGMETVMRALRTSGRIDPVACQLASIDEINQLVGYSEFQTLEERYRQLCGLVPNNSGRKTRGAKR
jgi:phosphoenolpyruvate phosphomutase